jgi:hypothetical protein
LAAPLTPRREKFPSRLLAEDRWQIEPGQILCGVIDDLLPKQNRLSRGTTARHRQPINLARRDVS